MFPMLRVAFALWFGWATMMAQTPAAPAEAAQLASRISSLLPRGATVSLDFQDLTPLSPGESSAFRGALLDELRKAGIEIAATGQPDPRVRVFVSDSAHGRLLVAEISTGENRQVAMLPWKAPPALNAKPRIAITQKAIWRQPEPILDFLFLDSDAEMLVLSPSQVTSYRWTDGKWASAGIASFSSPRPTPRDPRGRIEMLGGAFRASLPGATCTGEVMAALKVACSPGDAGLPVHWMVDRNLMESNVFRGPFYSEADDLFADAGGRIVDREGRILPGTDAWGSDIAATENPCGAQANTVIATAAGDDQSHDQIQIYEIADGHATPASDPLVLPDQVTALWASETKGQTTLVTRNPKTGEYEAYRLGLACAQ